MRTFAAKAALTIGSALIALIVAELGFRALLFSDLAFMQPLREPSLYADSNSDDAYWKLRMWHWRTEKQKQRASILRLDPQFGWINRLISPPDYQHADDPKLDERRPILLYGDSFAQIPTLGTTINADPRISQGSFLLNYGVAGYGVDQIYLMFEATFRRYRNPIVVFSLLTFDLDRSGLRVRVFKKPYFTLEDGALVLQGQPIEQDFAGYFESDPPRVFSYLLKMAWRKLPAEWRAGEEREKIRRKVELNRRILDRFAKVAARHSLNVVYLIFSELRSVHRPLDWRETFLKQYCSERGVNCIFARDVLESAIPRARYDFKEWVVDAKSDWHPNARAYGLIAEKVIEVLTAEPDARVQR